jgi:acyl carrier protein
MHLEKLFHIPINDDDMTKVKRVQDLYLLIEEKTSKGR